MVREDWRDLVAQKRAEVAKALPQEWQLPSSILDSISASADIGVLDIPAKCGLLSEKELDITENHDAVDLIAKMGAKELSSFEVTQAFCKRAAIAHQVVRRRIHLPLVLWLTQQTNCLTEMFFDKALERAKYLDEYLEREGKPMGPLHGMPISLKVSRSTPEQLRPTICSVGFVQLQGDILHNRIRLFHQSSCGGLQLSFGRYSS